MVLSLFPCYKDCSQKNMNRYGGSDHINNEIRIISKHKRSSPTTKS